MGGTRRSQRSLVVVAVAVALAGLASGLGPVPTPVGAQVPAPVITVEPDHDLVDGTQVTVTVTGVEPDRMVGFAQCRSGAVSLLSSCDTTDRIYDVADAAGTAQVSLWVDTMLTIGEPGDQELEVVDCRTAGACVVGVEQWTGAVVTAPLHFRPDAGLAPPPVLTVSPRGPFRDLQPVTVTGTGLVWSNRGYLLQCVANPTSLTGDCDGREQFFHYFETTGGRFTLDTQVAAVIETDDHGQVDCRRPRSCVLVATQDELRTPQRTATTPLRFRHRLQ